MTGRSPRVQAMISAEARARRAMARGDRSGVDDSGLSAARAAATREERNAFAGYLHGGQYPPARAEGGLAGWLARRARRGA